MNDTLLQPPVAKIKLKNGRGKKRRAKKLSKRTQVRIDPDSIDILRNEFGSLGNALYFLAQGINQLKRKHIDDFKGYSSITECTLNEEDVSLILSALNSLRRWNAGTRYKKRRDDIDLLADRLIDACNLKIPKSKGELTNNPNTKNKTDKG